MSRAAALRAVFACALAATLTLGAACARAAPPPVRDGDLIFHASRSAQSLAVQSATGSRYSHMGVVLHRDGKPYVFEAVEPARYTPLDAWIARGQGRHYVLKRLRQPPDAAQAQRLLAQAERMRGKHYDLAFGWSDDRLYCSELAYKLFDRAMGVRIGKLQRLGEFRLDDPAVKAKLRERYGARVPLGETVVSPAAMFDSPLLETVASG
ncbi:YiiX family permuted papain-like enzyme [Lysobacter enzymogenes]|uniref:YiiX family permuted papain-like enzyme n=1 Tax=Lysobacter enzymogenes TaxID=69 RepID=UPI001A96E51A|nr:YiiX family permuted papain-like enzyme [Lysobacter enzymogenes]QQP95032.1 YiiX family permuted papain-like enzyme [Lysobacter enzymogenes]